MAKPFIMSDIAIGAFLLGALLHPGEALAGPQEQCYRMHNRLTGVPPAPAALDSCVALIGQGKAFEAALAITEHQLFYDDTLKVMFTPWTNEGRSVLQPLNDFSATAIGLTRDDTDFRQLLSGDIQYVCSTGGRPALNNNTHYNGCGDAGNLKSQLIAIKQSELNFALANKSGVPAGVFTTRQFAAAFYNGGTNRAATRFTLLNFLCEDMEAFHDTTISDVRVRQDIDRSPGGNTNAYVNECKGCHAGMDPLTGAFAYLDFDEASMSMSYTEGTVAAKYFQNSNIYPDGYKTSDDRWLNLWTKGANARVGWNVGAGTVPQGQGPKSLGEMFAGTEQFATCMAKQVLNQVCTQEDDLKSQRAIDLGKAFRDSGYKMKDLFARSAVSCMGE